MTWVIACGVYNLAFGLFHLTFWRLLHWREQLPKLSWTNWAVMQALNLCLTFFFFLAASLYLIYPKELQTSSLGAAVAVGILGFWILRTVLQLVLFDLKHRVHQILLVVFGVGILLHV